jgi:hypothetical protein
MLLLEINDLSYKLKLRTNVRSLARWPSMLTCYCRAGTQLQGNPTRVEQTNMCGPLDLKLECTAWILSMSKQAHFSLNDCFLMNLINQLQVTVFL